MFSVHGPEPQGTRWYLNECLRIQNRSGPSVPLMRTAGQEALLSQDTRGHLETNFLQIVPRILCTSHILSVCLTAACNMAPVKGCLSFSEQIHISPPPPPPLGNSIEWNFSPRNRRLTSLSLRANSERSFWRDCKLQKGGDAPVTSSPWCSHYFKGDDIHGYTLPEHGDFPTILRALFYELRCASTPSIGRRWRLAPSLSFMQRFTPNNSFLCVTAAFRCARRRRIARPVSVSANIRLHYARDCRQSPSQD